MLRTICCTVISFLLASVGSAQNPAPAVAPAPSVASGPIPYGEPISLTQARQVMEAAEKIAAQNSWPVAIAIVDGAGHIVLFARMDNTQYGSVDVAIQKAKTAALFRRTTKEFEDRITQGGANLKILGLPVTPVEGGVPIVIDGKIVGAIGVSGVLSTQDGEVATAGAKSVTKKDASR